MSHRAWLCVVMGSILWFPLPGQPTQPAGWKVLFSDSFEDGSADRWDVREPEGSAGTWRVRDEGANFVFAGRGFSWVVLRPAQGRWLDFRFKARVKVIAGVIILHYRVGATEYHMVGLSQNWVNLVRTGRAGDQPLVTVPGDYPLGKWHQVEIVGTGTNLKVYVDGVLKIDYTDSQQPSPGTVGFEAPPGSSLVEVDDVEISGPVPPDLNWAKTGGPIGGIGYDVRMRPDNPDIMYATDAFSGVNISTDGGRTWRASNSGILTRTGASGDAIPVFCLTVDPHNPDTIWIGTQEKLGIYKSTDGGKTWSAKVRGIEERNGITFRGFTVDPRNSNVVYAAAELSSFAWAGQPRQGRQFDLVKGVVYKTVNGGEQWTRIWRGDNLARYVWIDPRDSSVVYVSTGIFDREAANSDPAGRRPGGVGIIKSMDGGATWQVLGAANGLPNLYLGSLFMHPQSPDTLLAGAGHHAYSEGGGVFLSMDGGRTWRRTLTDTISAVEFAASDPRVAYAASELWVYRSENGGNTWNAVNGPYYGPPGIRTGIPVDIQVDPRNPDRVFINNYSGGNFLSNDGGKNWVIASKGYTGASVFSVAVDPGDARHVYSLAASGVFRSLDAGDNWTGITRSPAVEDFKCLAVNPDHPRTVLVSCGLAGELCRTTDAGETWVRVFRHPEADPRDWEEGKARQVATIAFSPSDTRVVYIGLGTRGTSAPAVLPDVSFGVFRSADGGVTWQDSSDATIRGEAINALAVDPRDSNIAYAGTMKKGVLRTLDGGRTWRPVNEGLQSKEVRALTVNARNPLVLYAGFENGGLFKSIDAGSRWQLAGYGMDPQATVRTVAVDPADPEVLYAADHLTGVYRSTDGGRVWVAINQGLSTRAVSDLAISSDGTTLYAATAGGGVFRLDTKPRAEAAVSAVSAASFAADATLAPESIASLFGRDFADPTVVFTDSSGADATARLFVVTPTQVNCLVPAGLKTGPATVRVLQQNRVVARGQVRIEPVAPGIFTANADGKGVPAAVALRIGADGSQAQLPVFQCAATCTPASIDLGAESDQVILLLFGTGIRGGKQVSVRIGGLEAPVLGVAAQRQYVGLDQVNVRLPRGLSGRGEVDVALTVNGKSANVVKVRIQ